MTSKTRSTRARALSLLVLIVLLCGTVTSTMMLRNLVRNQERDLLRERTAEAGLFLSNAVSSAKPTLEVLGATYLADPGGNVAKTLTKGFAAATGSTVAIVVPDQDRLVARVAGGPGVAANGTLTGARADLVRRAIRAKDLVTDVIGKTPDNKTLLGLAVALPNGVTAYEEQKIDPTQLSSPSAKSPFGEIWGAVFASPTANNSKLLFLTAPRLPLHGAVESRRLDIGGDQWLLVASARTSLGGSLAGKAPWIVFALGVLLSLVAFAAVDVLLRRRAYALALVDERTATLRRTMTELEAARTNAEAANQAKSEFLSRMSHELRTPLNAVLGFAQVLELGDLTDPQRQAVTQISKGGQHLLELINDVLDISRIETGNLTLSSEPVLVADVVDDVLDLVEPLAAQRDIRCTAARGDGEVTYVLADRQRLKQILLNLLANAVKYNHQGGAVTISCEPADDGRLRINVTDTGPGIPADRRDRLFEPFDRLGAEQTGVEGAGIGLAFSRRLAEAMDGVLDVNTVEGEGSTFWIELQRTESPVERHERTSGGTAVAPPASFTDQRYTVLYVEDNLANVKLIEHVLDYRPDVHLITAMQGRLGIELALQHRPELILLDLHLPDVGGETVLSELRAHGDTATTPIIVLTADATERQHTRLLAAGATAYLTKPIDVRQLLELVDQQLAHVGSLSTIGDPTLARRT
ncbi:MAG TPA: ATP-binding protein [Acidimicrobiales bacterium]|nr:ATP-binding protein [Acidimicrobiales bacterium]